MTTTSPLLLIGGPGTGKTERLVQLVEQELKAGAKPNEIALLTFTKAAAEEAKERLADVIKVPAKTLSNVRTLHSLCFRELGMTRADVLTGAHLKVLEELTGERTSRGGALNEGQASPFEVDQLARSTYREAEELAGLFHIDIFRLKRALSAYKNFKEKRALYDFTDMLQMYVEQGKPLPSLRLAIVDEAQDLTPLQWNAVKKIFMNAEKMIYAGDDDQAIHTWAGATVKPMLEHTGPVENLVLSHRLPRRVHKVANSVVQRIKHRRAKENRPSDREGGVHFYSGPEEVKFDKGSWLILTRARYQLREIEDIVRSAGVPYAITGYPAIKADHIRMIRQHENLRKNNPEMPIWHDALPKIPLQDREYILACLRRGEKVEGDPRVNIETVHGSKGRQADNVLLLTDLPRRVFEGSERNPDSELRVLYVGVTRARESLHIVHPRGNLGWSF